jgi:putative ABC transport system ATP-binding protein
LPARNGSEHRFTLLCPIRRTNMSPVDSSEHLRFRTRSEAGQLLASSLLKYAGQPGVVVLGLSPAGVAVAAEVARRLAAPLDVLIVRRLAIPCREELTRISLLNILGGLDVTTSGTMQFRDHDLTASDDAALTRYRREHVGFVFQFYNLMPSLTARENVELVTDIAAHPLSAAEALGVVGLRERLDHFPSQLSGGEQQRVAIARAIAKRPDVLLCDEPTGALDVKTGVLVLDAIDRVNRELGTTTVVITHNAVIAGMADRVIALSDGRIASVRRNSEKRPAVELEW